MSARTERFGRLDVRAQRLGTVMALLSSLDWKNLSEGERTAVETNVTAILCQLRFEVENDARMAEQEGRLAEQVRQQAALQRELGQLRARIELLEARRADDSS
ncbi:hypothetical protein [Mycobacteroides chelonae]|uniref:hypothetical protein n=1 Tax=Mycobacteroides chelonae TaxID=1774 RepID=UPI000991D628|nr:hypothetical protein [Mycobacteroides chelonae]